MLELSGAAGEIAERAAGIPIELVSLLGANLGVAAGIIADGLETIIDGIGPPEIERGI